ncbi:anthranilate synthase component I [Bisgaardia hudsonensis]|uniref:Anthranilate synthase component 1 n=1 Tax=Bisgaardia hudsonensis TaxID=109472 RepID=A0A4R2N0H3_9PAST|nr:anthranilate synthase component 1 [Bisgaardia hudsonensis]QLB13466.1 anthranilate synthase component I [Bisgaardia hudsonensis]TCP12875.1 anthranilate synthase component I [Bisgaardia hudsonensis]
MYQPFANVKKTIIEYYQDPTALFATLCADKKNSLLLESAEINSKNSLKSLLLIDAAIRITCHKTQITFHSLSENGKAVLPLIRQKLQPVTKLLSITNDELKVEFFNIDLNADEDTQLVAPSIFDGLRCIVSLYENSTPPIFLGGLFSYDLITQFIPMDNIILENDEIACPDYVFYLAENLLVLDHQLKQSYLQTFCFTAKEQDNLEQSALIICKKLKNIKNELKTQKTPTNIDVNLSDDTFKSIVSDLKKHLEVGDVFQIVPSRRFSINCPNPLASYRQLKLTNPSPYMFYMNDEDFVLFGASPESALKYSQENRQLEVYPIAGSRPRGFNNKNEIDLELDSRLELELRLDQKEISEHLMLVDLARNDVARVSETGSRRVEKLMQIDRYSHIMHLVSQVVGKLRPQLDAIHAYQACMNMGTLTGAPKVKATQLIYQIEKQKRHSYGGAIGYLTSSGDLDTCIVIRSAFVQNNIAQIQAGCGVVLDSDPQKETEETSHKARAVINAILQTNQTNII